MEASTPAPPSPPPPEGTPLESGGAGLYPARFEIENQGDYNRFLPLVKWLLAFPHYLVLAVLGIGAFFVAIIAFFAVLFTARYPRGLWNYMAGVLRWAERVYAYVYLLTDRYPPFSLDDDPGYPARVEIDYPEHVERWRPLVAWLLIIPYYLVTYVLLILSGIVAFIGIFVILFTAKLPEGMFALIRNPLQWALRTHAYSLWMVTLYPPFEWEE